MHPCRLTRLAGRFLGQLLRCQPAQLIVDQRQKLVRRPLVALLDSLKDLRNSAHALQDSCPQNNRQTVEPL
jgi:hypothetical protein